jgi:HK97 family phage prohead protease
VLCRYNHSDDHVLGTTAGRTLQLTIDKTGLDYIVEPPQSRSDIVELVERGDVSQSSFAFRAIEDDWDLNDQGFARRTLYSGLLKDVAPCVNAAYPDATAGLRSLAFRFDADLEEVRSLAEQGELRKFFVVTSNGSAPRPTKVFAPAAAAQLLARREDPWSDEG